MEEHKTSGSAFQGLQGSSGDPTGDSVESHRGDEPVHEASFPASENGSSVGDDDDLPRKNERKHSASRSKNAFIGSTDDSETSEVESELVHGALERNRPPVHTKKRARLLQHRLYAPDSSRASSCESFTSSEDDETGAKDPQSGRVGKRGRPRTDVPLALDPAERKSMKRRVRVIPLHLAARMAQKEKWTECVAAAHIVQDEVNRYMQENPVSLRSRDVIAEWTGRVTKALVAQNSRVLDNVEAVAAAKTSQSRVDTLRNDVLRLKNHVRISVREHEHVQEQIEKERQHNASCRAATRFLKQIDRLRK